MEHHLSNLSALIGRLKLRHVFVALVVLNLALLIGIGLRGLVVFPQNISLGIFTLHLYSLALISAFGLCTYLVERLAAGEPLLSHIDVWEGVIFVFVPAIIGARLYHVITDYQLYNGDVLKMLEIWNGGLGFIGGVAGGALGLYLFAQYRKLPLIRMTSVVALVIPLGQAIGRLGNFFNHELYGPPTDLPWGQFIPESFRKPQYLYYAYFQPLFLYEMLANLLLFAFLCWQWRRGRRDESIILYYLLGYGVIRFCLDFIRIDGVSGMYGMSYTQLLIAGCLVIVCGGLLLKSLILRILAYINRGKDE